MRHSDSKTPTRWPLFALTAIAMVAVGAGATWGAYTVMTPAEDPFEATDFTYTEVAEGQVGASITLNTVARWTPTPSGVNRAAGVVTSVEVSAGEEVAQGTPLYSVDLRPVVIAQGDVPAFRTISLGAQGPDVEQLQVMLGALGHYGGTADGKAEAGTVAAIRAWQKASDIDVTGEVQAGDVIFVPSLPTRVALDNEFIHRGATLAGSEAAVQGLPNEPEFSIPVTDAQAGMLPAGARVEINSPEGDVWAGYAGDARQTEDGSVTVSLAGVKGGSICGEQCGQVPLTGQATLTSRIITVENVQGLTVPSAALIVEADGQVAVIDDAGARIPVTVDASARGMSVVTGVDAGTRVRVPASASE